MTAELLPHRLDLFHSPDFIPPYHAAKHHIITVHDLTFLHYPEYITDDSRRYYNDQIQSAVNHADHILSDSESTKRDLIHMLNVPADKITVHMLGVDEKFQPLPTDQTQPILDDLGLPSDYILVVGTLEPRKNLIGLVKAYRDLLTELPDAPPILFVGRAGWLYEQLMAEIDAVGINDHLMFRDDINDEQLVAIYNHALTLVTPSFYEGFGLPALEAMACGTVPIISNISSLPEITGDVGLLIDPHDLSTLTDALKKVLTDSTWRTQQATNGIQRAKTFRWEDCAQIVQTTYNRVLGISS
jgi:glycosyltransferase involved in cell wall biosynthesis